MNILGRQYSKEAVVTARTEDLLGLLPTALFTLEERLLHVTCKLQCVIYPK